MVIYFGCCSLRLWFGRRLVLWTISPPLLHLSYRWLHRKSICCKIFPLVPSFFIVLCHLAHNTGTSEWPNVLTVSHCELLYEAGLTAHKLRTILFTTIFRFIDCLLPVTVLATLSGQAPKVLYVFQMFLKKAWSCEHPCIFFIKYNRIRP
jgi:hypothetical protein